MPGITTAFAEGVAASRPAAASSNQGYMYYSTDTQILSQSNGSSWTQIAAGVAIDALTTKGDLVSRTSSAYSRLGVGSNDQVLTADSTASTGLKWATPASGFSDPLTTRGDLIVRGASSTTRLALGSSGQYLKSDGTDAVWAAAASGGLTALSGSPLTVSDTTTSSVTLSSISGSYSHLLVCYYVAADTTSAATGLWMRFNGDTGSNYDSQRFHATGAASGAGVHNAAAQMYLLDAQMPDAQSSYAGFAGGHLYIYNYANASLRNRMYTGYAYTDYADAAPYIWLQSGKWRSTSAITSVTFLVSTGHFKQNSEFWVYGIA